MKSHADKSSTPSTSTVSQIAPQPFVARRGEGSFFAPSRQSSAPGIQTKITVNTPGDRFEQEADRTADTVTRASAMPSNEPRLQRQVDERLPKKEEDRLQRVGEGAPVVSADVQSGIRDQLTGGQPLGGAERVQMEPCFGADFSGVRVHTDGQSAALSNQLGARAFTLQNHIFFAGDEYQPSTSGGQQLLAHELTHTIQQAAAPTREAGIQRAPAKTPAPVATSSEVVNLASGAFSPSQKVHDEIEAQAGKGLAVRVVVKGLTDEGQVRIRADRSKNYSSIGKGSMPLLNPWTQQLGGMHLNFIVTHNEIKNGYASLKPGGGDTNDWMQAVQKTSSLLGGLGLKVGHLPTVVNKFEAGKLTLGVSNLKVEVGGFVDALFNLSLENASRPKIDATADVKVKGIAEGQLKLDNTQDKLAGEISLAVNFKAFSGAAKVKYNADGTVDVGGKAAYSADKLSGEIQFVGTDLETANAFARDAIKAAGGKDKIQDAPPPAPVPAPKVGKKQRGLAATGQLAFNLTTWFAGTVNVVADAKGDITVIGKIAPPGEILLFKQRDWDKELIKFEAKAYYGIPVVGDLNLFANISLHALASLGPAKLYQIEILGTYSTDPEIQKNIQISGSFNISAYAGLRLRAEGGLGIEILSHDLKFGVGVNADVGVKAYADARPTIGYRDPGEFYVSGTLEMVAQPMLGLSGDFFIELETPWWSPLSDDKWVWPLFSKEWPLTDPIGLKAVVKEYVLGSGKVPEIELKPPEFDPSKFMTNMVDRTLPDKSSGKGGGQGTFKDDGTVPPPVVPPKKPEPKKADAKPGKKGAPPKTGKSGSPDPKAAKDQSSTKILQAAAKDLKALQGKGPYSRAALDDQLKSIKQKTSGIGFDVQTKGDNWLVTPVAGNSRGKGLAIKSTMEKGQEKPDVRTEDQKHHDKMAAIAEAEGLLPTDGFDEKAFRPKLGPIRTRYRLLTLTLIVDSKTDEIETLHFTASASQEVVGKPKQVRLTGSGPVTPVPEKSWIKTLKGGSFEQVTNRATAKRRTPDGAELLITFATAKPDGGSGTHSYKDEGIEWARTTFTHASTHAVPAGPGKFELKLSSQGRDFIRPTFYDDTSTSRGAIVSSRLPALLNPANNTEFLSEGNPSAEAAQGYAKKDAVTGRAVVPVSAASPDHDPPIAEHWSKKGGNDATQAARTSWNVNPATFKIMSLALNLGLGARGATYTKEIGINFRGPGE